MGSDCLKQEKYTGCLLGGAIGDALGAPIEFLSLKEIREQFGYDGIKDFHPAYGKLGAITDDTQMTLFTAEGLLRGLVRFRERGIGGAEIILLHEAYLRWLETQKSPFNNDDMSKNNGWLMTMEALRSRRGPGNTCISSLSSGAPLAHLSKNQTRSP